jgi:ERCC4-type nuclease
MLDLPLRVVPTSSREQTAELLAMLENRPRRQRHSSSLGDKLKTLSLGERQILIVQGLPGARGKLSREMLGLFGPVCGVFLAGEREMRRVDGRGERRAHDIRGLLDAPFAGTQGRLIWRAGRRRCRCR